MADCWWMYGEEKVDYGGYWNEVKEKIIPWIDYHCAICLIVKFDDKVQEKIDKTTYDEFYNYLDKNKKDDTQTYLEYLYNLNFYSPR